MRLLLQAEKTPVHRSALPTWSRIEQELPLQDSQEETEGW
jgi:hypothetical protein